MTPHSSTQNALPPCIRGRESLQYFEVKLIVFVGERMHVSRSGIFDNRVRHIAVIGLGLGAGIGAMWLEQHFAALAATGDLTWSVPIPVAIAAVVASDALLFSGGRIARSAINERTTWWSDRTARYVATLAGQRNALAIAVARFVPGIRTLVFVSLGADGLSRGRFLLIDRCAAAAWVPLVTTCSAAIVSLVFGEDSLSLGAWI